MTDNPTTRARAAARATSSATALRRPIRTGRGVRIALQIVLNYEEGGENAILHGDAASEAI